jgi:hypothetical protein
MTSETPISDAELDAMQRRVDAARKGPWKSFIEGRDHECGSDFIMVGPEGDRGEDMEIVGVSNADQDFIAAARQDVPRLIAEVRRLREELGRLAG